MKIVNSLNARKEWSSIQHDAISGEVVAIQRHGTTTAMVFPPRWEDFYSNSHYVGIMNRLRQYLAGKSDEELFKYLLEQWAYTQDNEHSKSAILQEISEDVKAIRRKLNA